MGLVLLDTCPRALPGAQKYVDQITGYVQWGVKVMFVVALVVSIGAIVAGRLFSMPQSSKLGVVSIVAVFLCAIAYLVLPGMLKAILGSGCI